MKRLGRRFKSFFFPTAANAYHPGIFRKESVIAIVAFLIFAQIGYFAFVTVVLHRTNFLAAVLPGVLTALTNEDRNANNVGALSENPILDKAAQASVNDMAAKGYFSHETPDGKAPWYWLDQAGYDYQYAGQNLAVDFTESTDVETAWMNSPTHRANIVKPEFTEVGIAVANGVYKGKEATFVVQFFGTPAKKQPSSPAPTVATTKPQEPVSSNVLGAETTESSHNSVPVEKTPSPSATPLAAAATSPDHTLMFMAAGLLALFALLLGIAIFVKLRVQYLSVLIGGLVLIAAAGASFFVSETRISNSAVELPTDTNSAAVYVGFTN